MNSKKVIVITGASSGIGAESAKLLAEDGHKIVLAARRENLLKDLAEEVKALGGEAVYQVTDVTKIDEVESLAKLAIDTFGAIDVWLNNAGVMPQTFFKDKLINEWDKAIDINIKGVLYGIGAALPYMSEKNSGHFINVASVEGHVAHAGGGVYSGTKWAVRAISESLREEMALSNLNIRVTIISPGAVSTELLNSVPEGGIKEKFEEFYNNNAISADRIALTIKQAIDLPEDASWNEVIIRPIGQVR